MQKPYDDSSLSEEPKLININNKLWSDRVLIVEVGDGWKHEDANFYSKPQFNRIKESLNKSVEENSVILYFNIDENTKPSLRQVIDIANFFSEIKILISKKVWSSIIIIRNENMRNLLSSGLKIVKPQRPLFTVSDEITAFDKILEEKDNRDKNIK